MVDNGGRAVGGERALVGGGGGELSVSGYHKVLGFGSFGRGGSSGLSAIFELL